jgi:uncharacterized protein
MRILVVGATGMVGSRVVAEAHSRDHSVTAVARSDRSARLPARVPMVVDDAADTDRMSELVAQHDVVIGATRPAPGREGSAGSTLLSLLESTHRADRRLLVVGGAGPLRVPDAPDRLVVDDPRHVPGEWRDVAGASLDQLRVCEGHAADWTYLSPPALLAPGRRRGSYRRGGSTLLVDPLGVSQISAEDLAVAIVDEVEHPRAQGRQFTVGY